MKLIVVKDYAALSRVSAEYVAARVCSQPSLRIGFCTGRTVVGFYQELVGLHRRGRVSFAQAWGFDIDEFHGLPQGHPKSYRTYLQENFFHLVDFDPQRIRLLDSDPADPEAAYRAYEEMIEATGGIDLQLDGIGLNGHLGFNEPGTPFGSRTRVVDLTEESRRAQIDLFGSIEEVPTRAVTRGILNIMRSREVLMMASGESKTAIVAKALAGPVVEAVPCSILQLHPAFTLIADEAAARDLLAAAPPGLVVERR